MEKNRKSAPDKASVSRYITTEGWQRLKDELSYLWKVKRPKVTQAVSEAAAMGDRSENAEYIYGKKQLREIDARLHFLKKRLSNLIVVDRKPGNTSKVFFGAWVVVEDAGGNTCKYRIVGSDESDFEKNFISIDSPMAKALLHKEEGDEIIVRRPVGKASFVIKVIHY